MNWKQSGATPEIAGRPDYADYCGFALCAVQNENGFRHTEAIEVLVHF